MKHVYDVLNYFGLLCPLIFIENVNIGQPEAVELLIITFSYHSNYQRKAHNIMNLVSLKGKLLILPKDFSPAK